MKENKNKEQGVSDSFAQFVVPEINKENGEHCEEPDHAEAKKEAKWQRGKHFNP